MDKQSVAFNLGVLEGYKECSDKERRLKVRIKELVSENARLTVALIESSEALNKNVDDFIEKNSRNKHKGDCKDARIKELEAELKEAGKAVCERCRQNYCSQCKWSVNGKKNIRNQP